MALELRTTAGVAITVIPGREGTCVLSIDGKEHVVGAGKPAVGFIASMTEIADPDHERVMRKCIDCGGRTYCITNGCANTPCGWICD